MINITNYSDHPTRIGYTVYRFFEKERADYFEELLIKENIYFASSIEENVNTIYLFGVKKGDAKQAMNANYLVSGKFRNKIIPNAYFRWGILLFFVSVLTLAVIGAILKT
tara:strand:- start:2 stop:331 length:330 start_codon:yes stop_codon:yes gene_type:complete